MVRAPAFQAGDAGSIPVACSTYLLVSLEIYLGFSHWQAGFYRLAQTYLLVRLSKPVENFIERANGMVDESLLKCGVKVKTLDHFTSSFKYCEGKVVTLTSCKHRISGRWLYRVEEYPTTEFYAEDFEYIVEECEPVSINIMSVL